MDYTKKIITQSNYWYNDGLRKAQIRDMSGAITSLRRSLQYNRGNIAARNLLGLVYYGRGEVAEALVEWIISKNLRPRDNIANDYIKNIQNSAKELDRINQAVKLYNQCLTYCEQDGEDMAIIQLKKVTTSHPTFLKAHQLLALLYLHTEQYAKAQQALRIARKLDTTNEMTLRYIHELTSVREKKNRKKGKNQAKTAVEYNLGNETIIQPAQSALKLLAGKLTIINIIVGILIGAAVVWFLIAPAAEEKRNDKINKQMIESSERINALEAQISAQTRTLDQYRSANENSEAAAQTAASTADSYENLMAAYEEFQAENYEAETLSDTLLNITRDSLGSKGQAKYDEMKAAVFPEACQTRYAAGVESLNAANYENAIDYLTKVVRMDASYQSGGALLNLGLAYLRSGDSETATTYLTKCNKSFAGSEYAAEAKTNLDAIAQANAEANAEGAAQ